MTPCVFKLCSSLFMASVYALETLTKRMPTVSTAFRTEKYKQLIHVTSKIMQLDRAAKVGMATI